MIPGQTSRSRAIRASRNADHWVYRCYDADGVLLYVGCTANVKKRIADHRRGNAGSRASRMLAVFMVSHEVDGPFLGRDAGRVAEAKAIRWEDPPFNMNERGEMYSRAKDSAGAYLVEHGRRDLAIELACTCWREARDAGLRDSWCSAHEGTDVPLYDLDEAAS